jgi:hypothetical protein
LHKYIKKLHTAEKQEGLNISEGWRMPVSQENSKDISPNKEKMDEDILGCNKVTVAITVTVRSCSSSKKNGPIIPITEKAHHTVIFRE